MNKLTSILLRIKQNKTIRNGALFSAYSLFNKSVGFVLLILLANYIMPEEYGLLSLFSTVVMFLGYFVNLNTQGYVSVSFFKNDYNGFRKDFSAICIITIVITLFITIILGIFHGSLSRLLKLDTSILFLCLIAAFCSVFIAMNLDYQRIQEKVSWYGILSCSFAILNMIISLYLVINRDLNWKGRVYAQIACDLVFVVIAIIWIIKDKLITLPTDWPRYKKIIWWGVPLIPHSISNWLRQGCDRYIIDATHSMADVGIFSFALNLISIIIMVGMAFNATNSVNLYQTLSSDIDEQTKKSNLRRKERLISFCYIAATIIIVIGVAVLVPIVLPHYSAAIPYFLILAIYGFMQCIYFIYCNYLFYFNKTKQLMYITLGGSILHLLLSLCLTRFSLYITCIVYVISFTLVTILVKRKAREIYPM